VCQYFKKTMTGDFLMAAQHIHHPTVSDRLKVVHLGAPGRVRIKVFGLLRSESLKSEIEKALNQSNFIKSVSVNTLTGNVLIQYQSHIPVQTVVNTLEGALTDYPVGHAGVMSPEKIQVSSPSPEGLFSRFKKTTVGAGSAPVKTGNLQPQAQWHIESAEFAVKELGSTSKGISSSEAGTRLAYYGSNVLSVSKPRSKLAMFAGQFVSPPVALLGISGAISIATGGFLDAIVIAGVVMLNAVIGYITESQAEKTINALGKMTPLHTLVLRDGDIAQVAMDDIVCGDVLVLSQGTFVAADARILTSNKLTVDESALTGESMPVGKNHEFVGNDDTPLADRKNMVYMGTIVSGGNGLAMVVSTGSNTEIGTIQSLVGGVETPDTPMQLQLDKLGTQLALVSAGLCAAMFGVGLLRGSPWLQMLTSAISLAVAAVPEGLPAVATTTLALGIRKMQQENVLVRQLPAVESLGSVQVICLDKTGTLTMNQMSMVTIKTPVHDLIVQKDVLYKEGNRIDATRYDEIAKILTMVSLCSEVVVNGPDSSQWEGSPTECALVRTAVVGGLDVGQLRAAKPWVHTLHRAEGRPFMATVHKDGERFLYAVKGSPSEVLALCRWQEVDGGVLEELDDERRASVAEQNHLLAKDALRVLGVAYRYAETEAIGETPSDLIWLGLTGMEDALRPGVAELMDKFHEAGIDTVMITGDQSATAASVGTRLRLANNRPLEVIDSSSIDKLEPEILQSLVKNTTVFARVSPAHKVKIVQALQATGRIVAMTGDGVNDGPALKASNVGVAMGDMGSDVARAAADVVLKDDNISTMITAVEQGRTIYANIRKSLRFLLSSNMGEIEIMFIGTALGMGEVLSPIQILWINLLTDILPAMALSMEPPESDVLQQKPRDPKRSIIERDDFNKMFRESLIMSAGALGVYGFSGMRYGFGPQASTNLFMTITMGQLLNSIGARSETTTIFTKDRPTNPYLNNAVIGSMVVQVLTLAVPQLRTLLRLSPVGPADIAAIAAGSICPMLINEAFKTFQSRK
jgi:Ca2+-transporting ATPase